MLNGVESITDNCFGLKTNYFELSPPLSGSLGLHLLGIAVMATVEAVEALVIVIIISGQGAGRHLRSRCQWVVQCSDVNCCLEADYRETRLASKIIHESMMSFLKTDDKEIMVSRALIWRPALEELLQCYFHYLLFSVI